MAGRLRGHARRRGTRHPGWRCTALGGAGRIGVEEASGLPATATLAQRPLPTERRVLAPLLTPATVDDDRHLGVVLVALEHLVEELGSKLTREDAVDHGSSVRAKRTGRDTLSGDAPPSET